MKTLFALSALTLVLAAAIGGAVLVTGRSPAVATNEQAPVEALRQEALEQVEGCSAEITYQDAGAVIFRSEDHTIATSLRRKAQGGKLNELQITFGDLHAPNPEKAELEANGGGDYAGLRVENSEALRDQYRECLEFAWNALSAGRGQ